MLNFISINQNIIILDKIIYFGKILYFKDVTLPNYPDNLKIGYSLDKMKWANTNQYNVGFISLKMISYLVQKVV